MDEIRAASRIMVRGIETLAARSVCMKIQVNFGDVAKTDALQARVEAAVQKATKLFEDQVTRVEVHLRDNDGPHSGAAQSCTIEVRLAGHDPLAVEQNAHDLYSAIDEAAGKVERAIRRKLERHEAHKWD